MLIFWGIMLLTCLVLFYQSTIGVYKHNRKHKLWETRIVKTELGLYQVQCWQNDSADWYCTDPLNWYAIDNFGFNGDETYKTIDEAKKAKEEFDKKAYEWEHNDKVAEVIEGPKE